MGSYQEVEVLRKKREDKNIRRNRAKILPRFGKLMKTINLQIQESQWAINQKKKKKSVHQNQITEKQWQRENVKSNRGGGTNYTKNKRKMSIADLPSDNV